MKRYISRLAQLQNELNNHYLVTNVEETSTHLTIHTPEHHPIILRVYSTRLDAYKQALTFLTNLERKKA